MGVFDFLKSKMLSINSTTAQKIPAQTKDIIPNFDNLTISAQIKRLLWFADGQYKNYDAETTKNILFENELFRISCSCSWDVEPSLIFSTLPIRINPNSDPNSSIGYFPTYEMLNPDERWTYLEWLCDIKRPIDIGYVFIFYYGLERHLIYGEYKEAVDTILLLRQCHKNNSFQTYSLNALIVSALFHQDNEMLLKILDDGENATIGGDLLLMMKYILKLDLSEKEIISLSGTVGFKNRRYINGYPDLFKEKVGAVLTSEFGKKGLPFYDLATIFEQNQHIAFANISLPSEVRSPIFPSITSNADFKESLYNTLSTAHGLVKSDLAEMRKKGMKPMPLGTLKKD